MVVANIDQVRAAVMAAMNDAQDAHGGIQMAIDRLYEAQRRVAAATDGTNQPDAQAVIGGIQRVIGELEQMHAAINAMVQEGEGIAARL